jgi:signal transduction histidine kinase
LQLEADGLMSGFRELAAKTSERFEVSCLFRCEQPVMIHDTGTAMHLYRIAQEAVSNAIKHGKAKHIVIGLNHQEDVVALTVDDDGVGLPKPVPKTEGMGLRIMAYRARMIHGSFEVKGNDGGGTTVRCVLKKS